MTQPQPDYSAYREASFGHGIFEIKNRTHAHFSWHRNQDGYAVEADSLWLHNRYWLPVRETDFVASMWDKHVAIHFEQYENLSSFWKNAFISGFEARGDVAM